MNEMTTKTLTLEQCEARIQLYKEQTVGGLIGIGKTLIEAKEQKVVPHGQWEAWSTAQTGVSARQVQRMMQLAREVQSGSNLEKVDFSTALLLASSGLEEDDREKIAGEAAEEKLTRTEVQKLIAQARDEADLEASKRYEEQIRRQAGMDQAALRDMERAHEEALEKQRRELTERGNALVMEAREKAQLAVADMEERIRALTGALEAAEALRDNGEASRLRAQLEDVQVLLQRQTEDRKAAQAELLRLKAGQANRAAAGEETGALTLRAAEAARDAFLAAVSELQYMGAKFAQADETERQRWMDLLESIDRWVERSTEAIQTRDAGGVVV